MNRTSTAKPVTIPDKAVLSPLNKQWAAVALTRREVQQLLLADGIHPNEIKWQFRGWDEGRHAGSLCLSNGAKIQPGSWIGRKPPTRARTYLLTGYHYAGTDVASLVTVAA
jgi:hypothetical protein